ncbi:MAG: biopolymer transporter ExbD [Gemmatimonadota bacterium]|nr:biopolymer transporter ExbD [Gemmatimonadota bacterium]
MKRRFTEEHGGLGVRAEINVTSLVDVAFTLLIIFMITAPILQGGIEIEVPEAASGPLSSSEALVVSIDEAGQIYVDDAPVTFDEFDATIERLLDTRDEDNVYLKADRGLAYGDAMRVMGRLHAAGAAVNLITEPTDEGRP